MNGALPILAGTMNKKTTNAESLEKLCALRNHGSKFGIDRMRLLAAEIGEPQKNFPSLL